MSAATHVGPVRLLLVDDDESVRMLLEVNLGFDERFQLLATASSGAELLARVADWDDIDAVLVDVTLPDTDGIELVRKLRVLLPAAAIALYTGWSDDDIDIRAREAGANSVFLKSGDTRALLDELFALVD